MDAITSPDDDPAIASFVAEILTISGPLSAIVAHAMRNGGSMADGVPPSRAERRSRSRSAAPVSW